MIEQTKIIAILRRIPLKKLVPLCEAVYGGGIRCIEITVDQTGNINDTLEEIEYIRTTYDNKIFVGAGTVMTVEQLEAVKEAGAKYIISPNNDREIITRTKELGLISMPGALTPSEIADAYKWGADYVKVFPVGNFGPDYIKAIKGPMPHVPLLAVGGITSENAGEYIKAGACGIGIAGKLVNRELLDSGNFDAIREEAARYVSAVKI